jgi:hypothetical protein
MYGEDNVVIQVKPMQAIQTIIKTAVLGTSFVGFGLAAGSMSALAMPMMPTGYTLSKTQLKGQHCYRHNNEANLYCYRTKPTSSMMKSDSMMKKDDAMMKNNGSMMKKDDAMMKNDGSMMKKDDSMMKHDSTMQKNDTMMKK